MLSWEGSFAPGISRSWITLNEEMVCVLGDIIVAIEITWCQVWNFRLALFCRPFLVLFIPRQSRPVIVETSIAQAVQIMHLHIYIVSWLSDSEMVDTALLYAMFSYCLNYESDYEI